MKYNYFYKITNILNNKYYYGVHSTNNIDDGYMGSGKRIKYAFKKYGNDNFNKSIIKYFDTFDDALKYESIVVNETCLLDSNCYNIILGGKGGFSHIDNTGKIPVIDLSGNTFQTDVNNKEIGISLFFIHINKAFFKNIDGKIYHLHINDPKIVELNLSGITKNKILVKDKNENCYLVDLNDERIRLGELILFWNGRKHKEESKRKIGTANSIHQKGEKNSQYGTCWIHNINIKENKKIIKNDVDKWLSIGWIKGRKMKF